MITKDHKTHSLLAKLSHYVSKQVCWVSSAVWEIQTGLYFSYMLGLIQHCLASYSTAWSHTAQPGAVCLMQHEKNPLFYPHKIQ